MIFTNIFKKNKKPVEKNLVIYTAIFGKKDKLREPKYKPENADFVCFTDNDFKSKTWKVIKTEGIPGDSVRSARMRKILPHKYFPNYEYSLWVDGNLNVKGNVNKLIDEYLKDVNLAIFDHAKNKDSRDCVYDEAEAIYGAMDRGRYKYISREVIEKQIEKYKNDGYPKKNGLAVTMAIFRRHNEKDVKDTMDFWWNEVKENSPRDQISFNYSVWKNNLKIVYLPGDSRNNKYFKWYGHIN